MTSSRSEQEKLFKRAPHKDNSNKKWLRNTDIYFCHTFLKHVHACSVALSCPTLCDPMDCSPPGSSVYGIFQSRIRGGLPFPPPGDLSQPGTEPRSPVLQVDCLSLSHLGNPFREQAVSISIIILCVIVLKQISFYILKVNMLLM